MSKFIVGTSSGVYQRLGASSDGIYEALHAAGVFADEPREVRRVVIDLEAGSPAKVYVERFLDDSIVDVINSGAVEIVVRGKEEA